MVCIRNCNGREAGGCNSRHDLKYSDRRCSISLIAFGERGYSVFTIGGIALEGKRRHPKKRRLFLPLATLLK
jgi:hypothetical protein